jgi:hypothetical protein
MCSECPKAAREAILSYAGVPGVTLAMATAMVTNSVVRATLSSVSAPHKLRGQLLADIEVIDRASAALEIEVEKIVDTLETALDVLDEDRP